MPSTVITWATPQRTSPRNGRSPRDQQDEFALKSQQKAEAAQKAGRFADEIVPVIYSTRKGDVTVVQDEAPETRNVPVRSSEAPSGI